MHKAIRCRLGLVILLLILGPSLFVASAQGQVWVRVLPAAGNYQLGNEIPVEVWIEDVTNLYGAEVRLAFDAARVAVIDANPSLPGVQVQPRSDLLSPDLIIRNEANNEAGTVWYAVTQMNPSEPVSGTGVLFSFSLETLAGGSAVVTITEQILADPDANQIPADTTGAIYWIDAPIKVFLPLVVNNH